MKPPIVDGPRVPCSDARRGARAARRIAAGETFLRLNIDQVFSLASVNRDPVLGSSIGRGSEYFEEVLPRAIEAQSMSLNFNDEYILSLAILYHISLGSQSSYWGYMTELLNADVSGQGIYLSWEEVGSRFPDFDEDAWSSEQEEWEEMYFVIGRRTRKHLERNFPDLWGPHVTVRGMPILSMENQVWASQIFYSRYWSNTEASHKDLSGLSGLSGPPQVGQRCKAKFKGDGKYYPGVIGELNEDGTFRVNFDDGDVDKKVELKDISEDDGSENGHAFLLPFADSLNYGLSCITCDFSHQDEEEGPIFACWAECDVEAGEALVWEYSSTTCKEQSLRAWGMATPNMKKC